MNTVGIIGAVTGVAALAYAVWAVDDAHKEMASLREEIDALHDRVRKLEPSDISAPAEPQPEDDKGEMKTELKSILRDEYGAEDEDEPEVEFEEPGEEDEDAMVYYNNASGTADWFVVERFDEDLDFTEFQYDADKDLLFRHGSVVNEHYPELAELLYADYYGDDDAEGHVVVKDSLDSSQKTFAVSILHGDREE